MFISKTFVERMHCNNMFMWRKRDHKGRAIAWLQYSVACNKWLISLRFLTSSFSDWGVSFRPLKVCGDDNVMVGVKITIRRKGQRQVTQDRMANANAIRDCLQAATNTDVSNQTVRNRLHCFSFHRRRSVRRPTITVKHRASHWAWCDQHVRWSWQRKKWVQVLFTGESRFNF